MKKFTLLFSLLLTCLLGAKAQITAVSDLSNDKVYTVQTFDTGRGYWTTNPSDLSKMYSTTVAGQTFNNTNPSQQFAFINVGDKYYLYSVGASKFVKKNGNGTQLVTYPEAYVTISAGGKGGNYFLVAINGSSQIGISNGYTDQGGIITFWNSATDGGNNVTITEVPDVAFDAAEAIAKINAGLAAERNAMISSIATYRKVYEELSDKSTESAMALNQAIADAENVLATATEASEFNTALTKLKTAFANTFASIGESSTQYYRLRHVETGYYMNVTTKNAAEGIKLSEKDENAKGQYFQVIPVEINLEGGSTVNGVQLKTAEGQYVAGLDAWNALTQDAAFTFAYETPSVDKLYTFYRTDKNNNAKYLAPNAGAGLNGYIYSNQDVSHSNLEWALEVANYDPVAIAKYELQLAYDEATPYGSRIGTGIGQYQGTTFVEAYTNAYNVLNNAEATEEVILAATSALNTAINTGLTINQPVNGKAYKLIAVYSDGKEQPLYWNGTRITAKNAENIDDANTSVFVARVLESGKVVFVNNAGKYLSWCDSGDADKSLDVNGYTDRYIVQNDWTIEAATNTSNVRDVALAGLYQISALGKNGTDMYYLTPRYEGDDTDAAFIAGVALAKWYDAPGGNEGKLRSYTFRLEEATYANTPVLNEAKGIDGIDYIGTFSAPFATVVPAGVEAWYVSEKTATSATMTALAASEAIPANEGVILTGAAAGAVTMLPVTSETVATISGNGLEASAGEAYTAVAGDYVMGLQNELVAFYPATVGTTLAMNKAYLNVGEGGGALAMNFGGNATGLNNAAATETNNAPVFDLSGRRVMHTVKGGLYIQNGKKFIVK